MREYPDEFKIVAVIQRERGRQRKLAGD